MIGNFFKYQKLYSLQFSYCVLRITELPLKWNLSFFRTKTIARSQIVCADFIFLHNFASCYPISIISRCSKDIAEYYILGENVFFKYWRWKLKDEDEPNYFPSKQLFSKYDQHFCIRFARKIVSKPVFLSWKSCVVKLIIFRK